jgi:hypothetical protein
MTPLRLDRQLDGAVAENGAQRTRMLRAESDAAAFKAAAADASANERSQSVKLHDKTDAAAAAATTAQQQVHRLRTALDEAKRRNGVLEKEWRSQAVR